MMKRKTYSPGPLVSAGVLALTCALCVATPQRVPAAEPSTLAVIPLSQGAGSEEYLGLGKALAGMLVSDLSGVAALQLVERDRLDDLMTEMELSDTGFVDESTAQKLGKGLGAELMLLGSYSVVGETFVMDGRIVGVESGEILKAVTANGTVGDFVSVEKELMEQMLDGIEISLSSSERRKLYLQAPTEQFDAIAAYGEGLQHQDDGDMEGAKAAFQRALELDPAFEAAREALAGLRQFVGQIKADKIAREQEFKAEAHRSILEAYPDERTRAANFIDTTDSFVGLALRLMVLENEELHCQRYEELYHYLERVDWNVTEPPRTEEDEGVWNFVLGKTAEVHGFERMPSDVPGPDASHEDPSSRAYHLWRTTADLVIDTEARNWVDEGSGLVVSIRGCFEPEEQLHELDRVIAAVREHDVAAQQQDRAGRGITLEESLQLHWCRTRASELGANAEMQERIEGVLAGRAEDDGIRNTLMSKVDTIIRMADTWENRQARRLGQEADFLVGVMDDIAEANPQRIRTESAACAFMMNTQQSRAIDWVGRYEDAVANQKGYVEDMVDGAGTYYAVARDLNCLIDEPSRFASTEELLSFIDGTPDRLREDKAQDSGCRSTITTMGQMCGPGTRAKLVDMDIQMPPLLHAGLQLYYGSVVFNRCVDEEW